MYLPNRCDAFGKNISDKIQNGFISMDAFKIQNELARLMSKQTSLEIFWFLNIALKVFNKEFKNMTVVLG